MQSSATIHHLAQTGTISPAQPMPWWYVAALISVARLYCNIRGHLLVGLCPLDTRPTLSKVRFPYLKAPRNRRPHRNHSSVGFIHDNSLNRRFRRPRCAATLLFVRSQYESNTTVLPNLDILNFFHLWSTAVLAIALSRLCNVTFKEASFWVFGYWLVARIVLISCNRRISKYEGRYFVCFEYFVVSSLVLLPYILHEKFGPLAHWR